MKPFIEEVGNVVGFKKIDLLEKDFVLHDLLLKLSENEFFTDNFLFKGGTCLIKTYLGYYRFSEDIDFTWRDQDVFRGKSQKEIRRHLSGIIDNIGKYLEKCGMEFISDKSNKRYIELVGGNKTVTFKLWYDSEILKYKTFIKIQINFVERILFPTTKRSIKSIIYNKDLRDLSIIFPNEYKRYSKDALLWVYDIKEILCEKVRAILTRRGTKARDFVDVYMICRNHKINIGNLETEIVEKTRFLLEMYERYRRNFEEKMKLIENSDHLFEWGDEKSLLLSELNLRDFYSFVEKFEDDLKTIGEDILDTK